MKNIVVVTDGAGFVGTNLILLLLKRTKFKNTAATMISMIIEVVRIVASMAARIIDRVSVPLAAAKAMAATTPSEAASVGVARPA